MKKEDKETLNEQPKVDETEVAAAAEEQPKVEEPVKEEPKAEEAEAPKEEEPKVEDKKEETPVDPDAPIVIDNTVEAPTQPIQDVPRYAKIKEPMTKKKKITILVIAIVAFIALFSIVFFPLFFCYIQGRIHIYNADDFVAQAGKRFVLEKDIVVNGDLNLAESGCSIDLNGHNLTVDGTLTLGNSIEVGTLKKGEYTSKGLLTVNSLAVDGSNFNFASAVVSKSDIKLNAETVTFNSVSLVTEAAFTAKSITFNAPLSVSSETTVVAFQNCESVVFNAEIGASTVYCENTNIVLNNSCTAHAFELNDESTLQAYGKLDSVKGGKKVAMLKGHECTAYEGVNVLAIYNAFNDTYTATDCNTIVYLETLPAPVDFIVKEEGSSFIATCAEVEPEGVVQYQFIFDSQKLEITSEPETDITDLVKHAGAATHKLQVYTIGNYNFETLDTQALVSGTTLYLDSETPATLEYSYTLKLSTPTNVEVKIDGDDNVFLSYSPVDFADYYVLTVDNADKYILTSLTKEEFESAHASVASEYGNKIIQYNMPSLVNIKAPITEQVSSLGYHSLRLVAASFSKEIETSKQAMTSHKKNKKLVLNSTDIVAETVENSNGTYTNTITINNCEGAKLFKIIIKGEEIRLSTGRTYSFTSDKSYAGEIVTVQAEAFEFYEASDAQVATFIAK